VRLEWSEAKRVSNIKKHGIDFADLGALFEDYTLTMEDDRFNYEEQRFVTMGLLEGRVVLVAHTEDKGGGRVRIISARKAAKYEEEAYFSSLPH
jgi:uncharacterized DUF497 family protein